jgi:enamine deaminase RidA (YjgF/YER057c/UK114 family)
MTNGSVAIIEPSVYPPAAHTAHAIHAGPQLVVSGQVPREADGSVPEDMGEQVDLALTNLAKILKCANFAFADVIMLRAYVTDSEAMKAWQEHRVPWLVDAMTAATSVIVPGLADPRWRIEIEAVAWRV